MNNSILLSIDGSESIINIDDSILSRENLVLRAPNLTNAIINVLRHIKSRRDIAVTLLIEYRDLLVAKKLVNAGLAENYHLLPLTDEEINDILDDPLTLYTPKSQQSLHCRIRELEPQAYTDSLTGLYNRLYMNIFVERIKKDSIGIELDVSMLLFDIDNLKSYNDRYGHIAGDKLLVETAAAMRKSFRSGDMKARVGGDEFAVILWDIPRCDLYKSPTDRRLETSKLAAPELVTRRFSNLLSSRNLSISGSLTHFTNDIANIDEVFDIADKKLYEAKKNGKNIILI